MFFFPITKKARERYALARSLYAACVAQARHPVFYSSLEAPDTFNGRFELVALHVGLVVAELTRRGEGDQPRLAQALFDEMFVNMDQSCREAGIGDLAVPRHMKRMMKALKGRAVVYAEAGTEDELCEALARNLYGTVPRPAMPVLKAMAAYVSSLKTGLSPQDLSSGSVTFPNPPEYQGVSNGASSQAA